LRDDEFCTSRHRKEYRERLARGLLQAQTNHVRSTRMAGFEEVLRSRDIAMEPLATAVKIDTRMSLEAAYSAFPLRVSDLAGAVLLPLDLRTVPAIRVVEKPRDEGAHTKGKPRHTDANGRNSMPSFLIPSPALNSCQSPQLEPHDPAGSAADLHICSSPAPLIAQPEKLKLPIFSLTLDLSVGEKGETKRKKGAQPATAAQETPAEVPPPAVTAAQPLRAPDPREVEAVPAREAQPLAWTASGLALPASDPAALFGAAAEAPAARITAVGEALTSPEASARTITAKAFDLAAAAEWSARAIALPSGIEQWLAEREAELSKPALAVANAPRALASSEAREREAAPAIELNSTAYPERQLAMPHAVSEELFPPELVDSEPPAVRPGEAPMAVPAPAAREASTLPAVALEHAGWVERGLSLSMPAVEFASGLRPAGLAAAKQPEAAEIIPGPRGVAEAIGAAPAAIAPALLLEPAEGQIGELVPAASLELQAVAIPTPAEAEAAASALVVPEAIATTATAVAAVPEFALEASLDAGAGGEGASIIAMPEPAALEAASSSAAPDTIATPAATAAPEFALEAATEAHAPAAAALTPAEIVPAASLAPMGFLSAPETIATPAATTAPEFALEAATEALTPAEIVPAASLAPMGLLPAPAAIEPAAAAAVNADSPWTVSEVLFPFEPSIEFVGAGIGLASAAAAEMPVRAAEVEPNVASEARPLSRVAELLMSPLDLEPEPPAYLTAEPPTLNKPLPFAAPAPAAREARPVGAPSPAALIFPPRTPAAVPQRPAPHGQEEFQAATANPAAALVGAPAAVSAEALRSGPAITAGLPLRPEADAADPGSTTPAGFILLDYHCQSVQAAPVPSFTWRWRIAATQLPELSLRTVPVKLEELIDEKKDLVRPFFQAVKVKVPKPSVRAQPIGLIAAAMLVAAVIGMGGHAAFTALRGGGSQSRTAEISRPDSSAPQVGVIPGGPTTVAAAPNAGKPGPITRLRQAIAERASLSLSETFDKGMEAWGQTKALAPGWVKSKDGYVRPGQLALYQPTLALSNYNMDFLGQIESKGMDWVVRAKDKQNYYAMKFKVIEPGLRPILAIVHYPVVNGVAGRRSETPLNVMVHNNSAYHITVNVEGKRIITAFEGQEVDRWIDDTLPKGGVGFFADAGERARVYWVKVSKNEDFLGRVCSYLAGDSGPGRSVAVLFPMEWDHGHGYNTIASNNY
jgi:hypothetical protein